MPGARGQAGAAALRQQAAALAPMGLMQGIHESTHPTRGQQPSSALPWPPQVRCRLQSSPVAFEPGPKVRAVPLCPLCAAQPRDAAAWRRCQSRESPSRQVFLSHAGGAGRFSMRTDDGEADSSQAAYRRNILSLWTGAATGRDATPCPLIGRSPPAEPLPGQTALEEDLKGEPA